MKSVYIDKLSDIIKEYTSAYHRTIKMKPIKVSIFIKILYFKLVIMWECQHKKTFLQKLKF